MGLFVCSSTEMDYFRFLIRCLGARDAIPVLSQTEVEYRAMSGAGSLARARLRFVMYVVHPLRLLGTCLRAPTRSLFIVATNPFFAPLLAALVGRLKRHRVVHLVYDLYPDALEVAGSTELNGAASRLLGLVTRWTQRSCVGAVYLGQVLKQHAERRWGATPLSWVIDVGADAELFADHEVDARPGELILHYGGQIGQMHDVEGLIAGIRATCLQLPSGPRFQLSLSGINAERLRSARRDLDRVSVRDAVPSAEWRELVKRFQVGLVTLRPGGATVCLPSKTYSLMAAGMAILAICPPWSDLARLVTQHDAGWVVSNADAQTIEELEGPNYLSATRERRSDSAIGDAFVKVVEQIANDPEQLLRKRRNARAAASRYYSLESISSRWQAVVSTAREHSGNPPR